MFANVKAAAAAGVLAELLFSFVPGVYSQSTDVVCSIYNWTSNSLGQNPCLVSAYLQGVCVGGQYSISSLPDDHHYIGPTASTANDCECNTVVYNLMSACGACQNRTTIDWSTWNTNCTSVYVGVYPEPIPAGTSVPGWAYLNVTDDAWDPLTAEADDNAPESTPVQKPTGSVTSSSGTSATTGAGTASSSAGAASGGSKTNTGAIAGGVVGGVVGLAILGGLIAFFVIRNRRSRQQPASAMFDNRPMSQAHTDYSSVAPFSPSAAKFYDPADPSTYPPTVTSPSLNTGYTAGYTPSLQQQQQQMNTYRPGQYTGAPEL